MTHRAGVTQARQIFGGALDLPMSLSPPDTHVTAFICAVFGPRQCSMPLQGWGTIIHLTPAIRILEITKKLFSAVKRLDEFI
jgi:hypothetical protein